MPAEIVRKVNAAVDERVGSQSFLKEAMDHIFPDNWSFMLGELAAYCFFILIITGIYLSMFFSPGDATVTYEGPYMPLHGVTMTEAYRSVVDISMSVQGGMLVRQMHHWAADLFMAALVLHMARLFFTGAFRKPRDINWVVGVNLFLFVMFEGFTGYSLPGDLLSGLGLRVAYTVALSFPVIGNWFAYLFFGGQFPSDQIEHRLFIAHVLIIPGLIALLLGIHLALIWRQKHTQFPGEGRSERRLVGAQLWPAYAFRSTALFLFTGGLLALLGGLAQINPVYLYGPYKPYEASSFAQPDWYVGWLEGTLRLFPKWQLHIAGYTVSDVFWAAALFPLLTFVLLMAYPWIERWWTSDLLFHNLLDPPRNRPGRTGFGVAMLTFYGVLFVAGDQDVLAYYLQVSQPVVTLALRGIAIVAPPVAGVIAWKIAKDLATAPLQASEPPEGEASGATPPIARYLPGRVRYEVAVPADGGGGDGGGGDGDGGDGFGGDGVGEWVVRTAEDVEEPPLVPASLQGLARRLSGMVHRSGAGE